MSKDFFNQFSSAICSKSVAASHKSSDIGLKFITESKLDVVTRVANLFWIISFCRSFLMGFYADHTAVNIDGDGG